MSKQLCVIKFFLLVSLFIFVPKSFISKEVHFSKKNSQIIFTPEDSTKSLQFLRKQIQSALKKCIETKTKFGIAIYSLDRGEYIFKQNEESYFIPASLTKLFTTVSALKKFGSNFQVKTSIYYSGKIIDNILIGDIYIYGRGDALLSSSDLDYFAQQVKNLGIKFIKGNIIADASFFDHQTNRFIYSGDADVVQELQPITALSLEKNIMNVIISAGSIYGRLVNVQVIPNSEAIKIYVSARVKREVGFNPKEPRINKNEYGGTDQSSIALQQVHKTYRKRRLSKGLNVSVTFDESGAQVIKVSGTMEAETSRTFSFFIEKPALVVAGALSSRLKNFGIQIEGKILESQMPNSHLNLIAEFSRPLNQILTEMNKNSDNYLAETIFKMIGAYDRKMTSDVKEATRYIFSVLEKYNISCSECKIYDGSGLSRRNRFSPESVILLLKNAKFDPQTSIIDSMLAVAGFDGTLQNRMVGTTSQGRVFAKTGTHSNASCLAGYLRTLDDERIIFAFMFNGDLVGTYKKIEDDLCQILSSFFYANKFE
ncbi:MAG: D-alanyl-D-alanine carboxypeptidase/D-alanyl-D-alanine endopeptidase [Candidatus Kapaibacteriales bacterium]